MRNLITASMYLRSKPGTTLEYAGPDFRAFVMICHSREQGDAGDSNCIVELQVGIESIPMISYDLSD